MAKRYNPNDPEQREIRQQTRDLRIQQTESDLQWLAADPRGRRILADIMRDCGLFEITHQAGDPMGSAFNEGRRSVALNLHNSITIHTQEQLSPILALVKRPDV